LVDYVDRFFAAMAARLGLPAATGGKASAAFVGRLKGKDLIAKKSDS
jgi:hypothetical protein